MEINPWPPRRVALATLVVVLVAGAFWVFLSYPLVFLSLFTAIMLSTAIEPLIELLGRRGISRTASIILISAVLLLTLSSLVVAITPLISEQWATITGLISSWYEGLRSALINSSSIFVRRLGNQLPFQPSLTLPAPESGAAQQQPLEQVQQTLNIAGLMLRGLFTTAAVALLSSLWAVEGERATRFFLATVPQASRESAREFISDLKDKMGAYTRGLIILCTVIGIMQMIAYFIIGLPNALLLGILAGLLEMVPLVGPLLGALPALVVAAAFDPTKILWVIAATTIIQVLENNLVAPRVMDRAVGVNPVVSLLAFVAFGSLFGLTGALLAIPLAAFIQLILNRTVFRSSVSDSAQLAGRDAISILRYDTQNLAQDVRKQVREKDSEFDEQADQVEDAMEAILQDLDSILAQLELATNVSPVSADTAHGDMRK